MPIKCKMWITCKFDMVYSTLLKSEFNFVSCVYTVDKEKT